MAIETLASLYRQAGHDFPVAPARKAIGGAPFEAAGRGRRGQMWNSTRLGVNTLLYAHGDEMRARCRDAVRNNPWASRAVDAYVANSIGKGIRMVCHHPDPDIRKQIQVEFDRWIDECDSEFLPSIPGSGRSNLYGHQSVGVREMMETGEVFVRFILRQAKDRLRVPLQIQLIESEQLPTYRMTAEGIPQGNIVRSGIEFDPEGRRAAYHFYKQHPGETMFYPLEGLQVRRMPAEDVLHVYKPLRAGQMRGQPWFTSVLTLLYEIDQYTDAEVVRKKVATMFAAFIIKPGPDGSVLPPDPNATVNAQNAVVPQDLGTANVKLEPGTLQELYAGEDIRFPDVPDGGNFDVFLRVLLRAFAAGCGGLTYEQVTGDLTGVNYSSIRAGLLEMRRCVEQMQSLVFIHQFCQPIFCRWLKEAVLAGVLNLRGYAQDPRPFEIAAKWVTPGWEWVDPMKDIQAEILAIRAGLKSRTTSVAETGDSAEHVDNQQSRDHEREQQLGLIYESNAASVLTRGESEDAGTAEKSKAGQSDSDKEEKTRADAQELGYELRRIQ